MCAPLCVSPVILVVDDDQDIRDIYAESLTLNGYEVLHAADGQEALAQAFATLPAAVVMDVEMPVMNGLDATRALKADGRTDSVPIVVVTGNSRPEQLERLHGTGCDAVLRKPCPPEVVVLAIEHLIRGEPVPQRFRPCGTLPGQKRKL